jgi:peptidylprolyl isomerase
VAQGGDPLSKDPAKARLAGIGGPCYAIRTEPSKRKPFRGVIAMARSANKDTEGSQFFLTTGTAANLEGDYSVFGRIVEGQEVADRLVKDVTIERVEVLRTRPGTTYRPVTKGGEPAPEPKPCGPSGRPQ